MPNISKTGLAEINIGDNIEFTIKDLALLDDEYIRNEYAKLEGKNEYKSLTNTSNIAKAITVINAKIQHSLLSL